MINNCEFRYIFPLITSSFFKVFTVKHMDGHHGFCEMCRKLSSVGGLKVEANAS